jgi:hypothetical protein
VQPCWTTLVAKCHDFILAHTAPAPGLQSSEGLGVVTYDAATLVTLGGCTNEYAMRM